MRSKYGLIMITLCLLALAGVYGYYAAQPRFAGRVGPSEATGAPRAQTAERGAGDSTFPQDRPDGSTSPASHVQLNYDALRVMFVVAMLGCAAAGFWASTRRDVPGHG